MATFSQKDSALPIGLKNPPLPNIRNKYSITDFLEQVATERDTAV
jgi:hypothetical protein